MWAQACKLTVELLGRVTRGADLSVELAELLVKQIALSASHTQEIARLTAARSEAEYALEQVTIDRDIYKAWHERWTATGLGSY